MVMSSLLSDGNEELRGMMEKGEGKMEMYCT
jgi:hypothetical protein